MSVLLPKSVTLLKSIQLSSEPESVSHWEGHTYVGHRGYKVVKVDKNYQINENYIKFTSYVEAVEVYKEKMYILVCGMPHVLHVCDMAGQFVTKWNHNDTDWQFTGLAIVADQVVIPDRPNKLLVVYSLSGSLIKNISCPLLSGNWVSMCAVDDDSVVVSDYSSSQVFKVNITTGEVMWTCRDVPRPQGVTCYRQKYILAASEGSSIIKILKAGTGWYILCSQN